MPALPAQLNLSADAGVQLATSVANYRRHARLELRIDTVNGKEAWCSAWQFELPSNGRVLTEPELLERAAKAFGPLRSAGYVPIINVYPVRKGPPEKPIAKHRLARELELRGIKAVVLRQKPPRILFTQEGEALKLLAAEHVASLHFFDALAAKAAQWLKREQYRL